VELLRHTGGKVHAFLTSLPNSGVRALKQRDSSLALSEKDKQMSLLPQDNTYQTTASFAADFNVCIDLFLMSQGYMDIATLGSLPMMTGGTIYHYQPFNPVMDQDQLLNDLKWNISRPQGFEAIMRVRVSGGLDVETYLGAFYKPPNSPTDIYLSALDCDKAVLAKLTINEKLTPGSEVYLQSALLYTTTDGARRIRISTIGLPVTDQMGAVFKGADLDSQLTMLTRNVAASLPGNTYGTGKDLIQSRCTAVLASYRKHCATSSSAVQLILPEALKLLPLYALALLKAAGLRPDVRNDERCWWLCNILCASPPRIMGALHPRMFPLHRVLANDSLPPEPLLPEPLVLSSEMLEPGGVYLLDNGSDIIVYFDPEVVPQLVQELLGLSGPEELARAQGPLTLVRREGGPGKMLGELLTRLRLDRCAYMRLRLTKKGDPLYPLFLHMLVEDRSTGGMSYVEWLCHIHRQIQDKMS